MKRFTAHLSDEDFAELERRAGREHRSVAQMAGILIARGLGGAGQGAAPSSVPPGGSPPPAEPSSPVAGGAPDPPAGLSGVISSPKLSAVAPGGRVARPFSKDQQAGR